MMMNSGITDVQLAKSKKRINAYRQECELSGKNVTQRGLNAIYAEMAREYRIPPEQMRLLIEPIWLPEQIEYYTGKFKRIHSDRREEWKIEIAGQTGVTVAYVGSILNGSPNAPKPPPPKRKKATAPTPAEETNNGPHHSAMVSGTG